MEQNKQNETRYVLAMLSRVHANGKDTTQSWIPLDKALKQWETRESGSTLRLKPLETGEWEEGWTQDYKPNIEASESYTVVAKRSQDYKKQRAGSDI
jgi:hypothetical protein